MNNTDDDLPEKNSSEKRSWRSWYRMSPADTAVVLILLVGCTLIGLGSSAGSRQPHTCVICRLNRFDIHWDLWGAETVYEETPCSRWYRDHIDQSHEHIWSKSSDFAIFNYYGQTIGAGTDWSTRRVVWRLTPHEQLEVYKHFDDSPAAKEVFRSLVDPLKRESDTDIAIVMSLREWIDSGFAESWVHPGLAD